MADADSSTEADDRLIEVFRVLGDPVRWSILRQLAETDELSCSLLERTLPVSKPTISYHTKLLRQVGLLRVRKEGRNYFYRLERDVFRQLVELLGELCPGPRLVVDGHPLDVASVVERRKTRAKPRGAREGAGGQVVSLLTW